MKTLAIIYLLFLASYSCRASEQDDISLDRTIYSDLISINQFFMVSSRLEGTAENIGLNKKEIDEFMRLKFINLFTGYPLKELPRDEKGIGKSDIVSSEWGIITVSIWTVGTDYPVAYHLELRMRPRGYAANIYEDASLGYTNAKALKNDRVIKNTISEMMERAAVKLMKIQGKI